MIKIMGSLFMGLFLGSFCYAQQAISTAGGEGTGGGGTVSFTVGQPAYNLLVASSGSAMQGVQQPYEILITTDFAPEITLECYVFPNPVSDFLILKFNSDRLENLSYQLIDINGKILEESSIGATEMIISLQGYRSTTYFVKVIHNTQEIKIFKINKI